MTKKLTVKEMVTVSELLLSNSIQVGALSQLLVEKGFITEQDFFAKLKTVQAEYQRSMKAAN